MIRKFSRKKKIIVVVLSLLLIVAGFLIWRHFTKAPKYTLAAAKFDSIVETVSETGNVTTAGAIPIYSTTTGMVEEVFVKNDEDVLENDILFKVKSTATKLEQDTALSAYQTSKNTLEAAKSTQLSLQADMFGQWDIFKELAESDDFETEAGTPKYNNRAVPEFHIPEKDWLAAEANYKNQEKVINQAATKVSADWRAYQATQDSQVSAHIDGQIKNLSVAKGDLVSVPTALTLANTPPALVLVNNDVDTIIKLNINETDANKVRSGQSVKVEFDAISGKIFSGKVDRVDSLTFSVSQNVVKFAVYIKLDDKLDLIKRGMTADVDITVASKDNVLTVPSSAVKPFKGGKAVRVIADNGEIEFIPVEVGSKGGGKVEIISGIKAGDQVVVTLANDQVERSSGLF
ncbi:MAG: efflux RND transporter periplasmic adaptor subunit [Patescibacteria group bacterium]|nr:efflux RND transporter periplasmic adaptor subunit [Candidatus Beckwithbacteria bacterium]MDZ4228870.1 efflux RND transporter periplasmic adaptor subunit [Patescibacteria group bacterium]